MRTSFSDEDFFPNFYDRLGIERTATATEIHRAYRKRAIETHPDTKPDATPVERENATKQFVAIGRAYDVLKDPDDKRSYDRALERHSPKAEQASSGPKPDFTKAEFYSGFNYTEEEVRRYKEACERINTRSHRPGDLSIVFNFTVGSPMQPETRLLPDNQGLLPPPTKLLE